MCYEWPATRELRERAGLEPFNARLVMPSTLTVHASREDDEVLFETRDERAGAVIERGSVKLATTFLHAA